MTFHRASHDLRSLCYAHNEATNPWICYTDHEHKRNRQRARGIRARLTRLGFVMGRAYHENENGCYWPISRTAPIREGYNPDCHFMGTPGSPRPEVR